MSQSASEMVSLYIAAEKAILEGKSFSMNGRLLTMENLPDIRDGRKEWERRASSEVSATRRRDFSLASFG